MLLYANRKIKGFALVTVLLFMQILALLGLYAIEQSLLALKTGELYFQRDLFSNKTEAALKIAESGASLCEIPVTEPEELSARPLRFWQSLSCAGNFQGFQYYYVSEYLGSDPCAEVVFKNTEADYFRITLLALSTKNKAQKMLQTIVIKSSPRKEVCQGQYRAVTEGRQSWRELELTRKEQGSEYS